jgi:serine/threonine-protein kinase
LFLCERDDGPPRIKLLDFGIAKIVAANAASANATQAVGTPLYMAPEQFLVDSAVSAATDLYALGMIAYSMLVGQTYWFEESKKGANVFAFAAYATLGPQEPASIRALRNGVVLPARFDAWFARATARKPTDRFPSATAMVAALSEALELPPPIAILASSYAQGVDQPFTIAPLDGDRVSLMPGASTASLLASARTTKAPVQQKRPMFVMVAIAISAIVLAGLLYAAFSSSDPSDKPQSDQASADVSASAKGLPVVVPIASTMPTPTPPPTESATAQPEPSTTTKATTPTAGPPPKNTSAPTGTTKTKKGKWIRD